MYFTLTLSIIALSTHYLVSESSEVYSSLQLSLKSLAVPSADFSSVVATKDVIFDSLLHTTRIASFSTTSGNLVINSTVKCVHSFFGASFVISFPTKDSVLFFILWHKSQPSTYLPTSLITPGY